MSIKKLVLRSCGLLVPVLGALYTAGCGGSAFSGNASGGAGGSAAGAAGGAAGSGVSGGGEAGRCAQECPLIACDPESVSVTKPGACCSSCIPDGQGGSGGASGGSAGIGGCSAVIACPAIACALGWTPESKPGDCCPTCVPNGQGGAGASGGSGGSGGCTGVMTCPGLDCAQGYKLEQQAGECCPTCVLNADACTQGQQGYDALRQKLLQQTGALACKVDADCTVLSGNAYCGDECSATPVSVMSAPGIDSQLSSYATNKCSTCTPMYPPCATPLPPVCQNALCVAHVFIAG